MHYKVDRVDQTFAYFTRAIFAQIRHNIRVAVVAIETRREKRLENDIPPSPRENVLKSVILNV